MKNNSANVGNIQFSQKIFLAVGTDFIVSVILLTSQTLDIKGT